MKPMSASQKKRMMAGSKPMKMAMGSSYSMMLGGKTVKKKGVKPSFGRSR